PRVRERLFDTYHLLSEWLTFPPEIEIAGVKYQSIINSYPSYWILNSLQDIGSIVLQLNQKLGYYFLCYLRQDQDPILKQRDTKKMADLFGVTK
ncbi:MAG: hypothetical protein ACFFE8_02895, partial [Candidatus Heimdallarchaeota archaeon]